MFNIMIIDTFLISIIMYCAYLLSKCTYKLTIYTRYIDVDINKSMYWSFNS